jgi:hypothetical protein
MKALAEELEKDEHGLQYKYITDGAMNVAARFSQLEARYEAARKRRHEDAYSELREHLIHKRINQMEADCKVMWAILNDPARAEELFRARASYWPMRAKELEKENEHMQARFMKYQEDIAKLRRQSADWNMWCLWESMHRAGPPVLQCTERLLAITVVLARHKWSWFITIHGMNVTPDIQNIWRCANSTYANDDGAVEDNALEK